MPSSLQLSIVRDDTLSRFANSFLVRSSDGMAAWVLLLMLPFYLDYSWRGKGAVAVNPYKQGFSALF